MTGPLVHPNALCEAGDIGDGTRVWAFAHVLPGAIVGRDCNICDHAYIEGGARLGDRVTVKNAVLVWTGVTVEADVFLGPNMVFTNDINPRSHIKKGPGGLMTTLVRQGATIGANATVVCGTTIGSNAFVGAGSVVITDVPAHALVVGNPARQIGWMCRCGERLSAQLSCPSCGRAYRFGGSDGGLVPTGAVQSAAAD